ncbi:putative signal peptide protein [Paraburkholderia caribensis MBA4]|uniref:Putative signal peptide protein n=1 Tax=Paraburkholderia caribensis MBA4 TaxID=1323664 RepID=A0A0P0RIH2_9BURK|nr:alpha/beta hydrolase [Paraburkholderia caribensis]ALL68310.1 putative signal peptide protein [Paraburkholderia caribensis MBA4]
MSNNAENVTVVLVHGAWADGSSWSKLVVPLKRAGLQVLCAPIPLTSLTDDIDAVSSVLERAKGRVVLVGHAYAGGVIGGITSDKVKGLVFVAALAPDAGETVADVFYRDEKHPESPELAPDARGFIWMPDKGFETAFAQNASDDEKAVAAATQRPISVLCIKEPVGEPSWKSKPSWYLVAESDRMINPVTQRFMAERMGASIRSVDVDHTPSITAPDIVVKIVLDAAGAAAQQV